MGMVLRILSIVAIIITVAATFVFALNDTNDSVYDYGLNGTMNDTLISGQQLISAKVGAYEPTTTDSGIDVFYIVMLDDGSIRPATSSERSSIDSTLGSNSVMTASNTVMPSASPADTGSPVTTSGTDGSTY